MTTFDLRAEYLDIPAAREIIPFPASRRTIYRWFGRGLTTPTGERVRLRSITVGGQRGRRFTTQEWIQEFLAAISDAHGDECVVAEGRLEVAPDHCTRAERALAAQGA